MLRGEDHDAVKHEIFAFMHKWKFKAPLHYTDMHSRKAGFAWLGRRPQREQEAFLAEWREILCRIPVIGIGCVVDRPGYVARGYLAKHSDKWLLCRSAFDITVERAVKIARSERRKLHIVFEQDAAINQTITGYFENLKENGLAFNSQNSAKYQPLSQADFAETLGRIAHKPKSHTYLQVADSYIYAICRGAYQKKYWLSRSLHEAKRLSDYCAPDELGKQVGIKLYCFDKNEKAGVAPGLVAAPIR